MKHQISNLPPLDALQRYTIDEACTYLRLGRAKVYRDIKDGLIKVIKDGRRTFIPGTEIVKRSTAGT